MMCAMLLPRKLSEIIFFTWTFLVALIAADDIPMIGPADFKIGTFRMCEGHENSPNVISIQRMKVNRTLESYQGSFSMDVDFDETVGINLNVAKWGDGGFKPNYYIENNTYACQFFFKWAAKGSKILLESAGRPGTCPIAKGKVEWKNFLVRYDEWPSSMVYGEFRATLLFIKNNEVVLKVDQFLMNYDELSRQMWVSKTKIVNIKKSDQEEGSCFYVSSTSKPKKNTEYFWF